MGQTGRHVARPCTTCGPRGTRGARERFALAVATAAWLGPIVQPALAHTSVSRLRFHRVSSFACMAAYRIVASFAATHPRPAHHALPAIRPFVSPAQLVPPLLFHAIAHRIHLRLRYPYLMSECLPSPQARTAAVPPCRRASSLDRPSVLTDLPSHFASTYTTQIHPAVHRPVRPVHHRIIVHTRDIYSCLPHLI